MQLIGSNAFAPFSSPKILKVWVGRLHIAMVGVTTPNSVLSFMDVTLPPPKRLLLVDTITRSIFISENETLETKFIIILL